MNRLKGVNRIIQLGNIFPTKTRDNPNQGRVYDIAGLSPAINCNGGGEQTTIYTY